ncbi:hypothetical protein FSP39_005216 [Pinctada imbricata]|uniref:tRNA-splicing endonuclease subunit Sen15 domain-containing protein n=1 Tax=Pinctada imbricata TaxID=66713 RepID=A0AA88XLA0_PINIB|nr:hypothetical protein FSP39_005216 [Pinctada imbricata]
MVTPNKLQEFLKEIKVDTNSTNGITLAVTDADSTLVYYKISDGLTVPEDPDMADTKKHARWLRFRHRQSHAQRAINQYTEAKSVGLNNDDTKLEGGELVSANVQHEGEEDDLVTLDEEEDEFGDEL